MIVVGMRDPMHFLLSSFLRTWQVPPKWRLPRTRCTFSGVHIIRNMAYWALYWGPHHFCKLLNVSKCFGQDMAQVCQDLYGLCGKNKRNFVGHREHPV